MIEPFIEDLDFNATGLSIDTSGTRYRSSYARCGINCTAGMVKSNTFQSGALTTYWAHFWGFFGSFNTTTRFAGVGNSGLGLGGLYVGVDSVTNNKLALYKYDGTTETKLASESGLSVFNNILTQVDMQVTNMSNTSTGNCKVYLNGSSTPVINFTGNLTVTGMTSVDQFIVFAFAASDVYSEFIIADEDTRTFSVCTNSISALGTTDQWTGAASDVNETVINDSTVAYTNTVSQDEQFNLADLPSGTFFPRCVKISARASSTAGATATKVALGVNSGGTVSAGTAQTTSTVWATFVALYLTNPVTAVNWLQSEINALQVNLRSS